MKPIRFTFGYLNSNKIDLITYWICKKLPFIPTLDVDLFRSHSKIRHSIHFGILKFYYRIYKLDTKGWRFENLTDK